MPRFRTPIKAPQLKIIGHDTSIGEDIKTDDIILTGELFQNDTIYKESLSVRVATVIALTDNSHQDSIAYDANGGSSGRGLISGQLHASNIFEIDGISLNSGDNVLLRVEEPSYNGIWTITIDDLDYSLERAVDFNDESKITKKTLIIVNEGTFHKNTLWILSSSIDNLVIGTDLGSDITFEQIALDGGALTWNNIQEVDELVFSNTIDNSPKTVLKNRVHTENADFPRPTLKPLMDNSSIAFDVCPTGLNPTESYEGFAWIDICDNDVDYDNVALRCLHLGATSSAMEIATKLYPNGQTATFPHLVFKVGDDEVMRMTQSSAYFGGVTTNLNNRAIHIKPSLVLQEDANNQTEFGHDNNIFRIWKHLDTDKVNCFAAKRLTGGCSVAISSDETYNFTTEDNHVILGCHSTNQGFLLPRVTSLVGIDPPDGSMVYYNNNVQVRTAGEWKALEFEQQ